MLFCGYINYAHFPHFLILAEHKILICESLHKASFFQKIKSLFVCLERNYFTDVCDRELARFTPTLQKSKLIYGLNYITLPSIISLYETCWSVILILLYNTNIATNKSLTPTNTFRLRWQDSAEKHVQVFTWSSNTPTCIAWLCMYCMS